MIALGSKGIAWPIVVPINTMTGIMAPESAVIDRERIRLWYIAATSARELLVLPRLNAAQSKTACWSSHGPPRAMRAALRFVT
jgi:hypothetical protein